MSGNTSLFRLAVRWGLYPLSWLVVLVGFHLILFDDYDPGTVWGASVGSLAFCI
jgi:hypothetical protein